MKTDFLKTGYKVRLLIVFALCFSLGSVWSAAELPARLSDESFWQLISELSEPGGRFPSDNFVSNELATQHVLAQLTNGRKASGAEAYVAYGRESGPVFERLGGRIVWQGKFELMLIGPQDERWDHCFIAEYPDVAAFVEMIRDPVYREAVKHRQAAVEDSRLIRHAVLPIGKMFGEIPK